MPRPADNYTMISHEFSRSRLSARAVKVGLYVLSHADGFTQTQEQIGRVIRMSVPTVIAALRDLEGGGFLVRHEVRDDHGRKMGTAYGITDNPQVNPPGPLPKDSLPKDSLPKKSSAHKKTSSRSETTPSKKTTPSGGETADAAPPSLEVSPILEHPEDAMTASAETLALFDPPETAQAKTAKKPKAEKTPPSPSAGTVVAAFVDSYRSHHSGGDPVKAAIGRVARDAKMMIDEGRASAEELQRAATAMGLGPYNNLAVALDKLRKQGGSDRKFGRQSGVAARPHTDPDWMAVAERNRVKEYNDLLTDDDAVRWARRDPAYAAKIVDTYPELADRFRDVA
jgi:hypothetical protein